MYKYIYNVTTEEIAVRPRRRYSLTVMYLFELQRRWFCFTALQKKKRKNDDVNLSLLADELDFY